MKKRNIVIIFSFLFSINSFSKGFYCIKDDKGEKGVRQYYTSTIQNSPKQWIKKIIDLSDFPKDSWNKVKNVYISIYCTSCNYDKGAFEEEFEIIINGKVHKYPLKIISKENFLDWYEFDFAKEEFILGKNEIIIKKAEGKTGEYLYIGIDTSIKNGHSFASYDGGKTWEEALNIYYRVQGEYLIRMCLITEEAPIFQIDYIPGKVLKDEEKILKFAGGEVEEDEILRKGEKIRLEWYYKNIDRRHPFIIKVYGKGKAKLTILDENWRKIETIEDKLPLVKEYLEKREKNISGLILTTDEENIKIERINLTGRKIELEEEKTRLPEISVPKGQVIFKKPEFHFKQNKIIFENSTLKSESEIKDNKLKFVSIYNKYTKEEMINNPETIYLFIVETDDGKIYKGIKDFVLKNIQKEKNGFEAILFNEEKGIEARLKAFIEDEGLRFGLMLTNKGNKKEVYKVAFPHFQSLKISKKIEDDWYFYPILDTPLTPLTDKIPVYIRSGYGTKPGAGFQILNIYSPEKGVGLYLRIDDKEGWFKILTLNKYIEKEKFQKIDFVNEKILDISPKFTWKNESLEKIEGIGFSCEYLGRERNPGENLTFHDCIIASHKGDWKEVMKIYSNWAHKVWNFRPYPSKITNTWTYLSPSPVIGGRNIFKDEEYLKKHYFSESLANPIEFWFWWEWSKVGPWGKTIEEYAKQGLYPHPTLGWSFIKHPHTGEIVFANNTGDYDYAESLGGLKGLQEAVKKFIENNKVIMWYTDPFRLYDITKTGQKYGKDWKIIKSDGKDLIRYECYTPCFYNPVYRDWITDTMKRVIEETDVDGIRYDEGGLGGWVCYSDLHQHTYCETGILEWPKAFAEICRLTREKVKKNFILTTEYPGYDYLMQFLDGTITHCFLGSFSSKVLPIELDLIRFYFPECKSFDISIGHVPEDIKETVMKKVLWNGIGTFGRRLKFLDKVFEKYGEIISSNDCEPLIPSLVKDIYINRFSKGDKTIYTLFNTGFTYKGPVIEIELKKEEEVFDILNEKLCKIEKSTNNKFKVFMYIEAGDIGVILKRKKM